MFRNYFKIALRNLLKNKVFSFINVFSLSIGLAIVILVTLWLRDELSYDDFHKNADRIYRVITKFNNKNEHNYHYAISAPLAKAIKDELPEVEKMVRFAGASRVIGYESKQIRNIVTIKVDSDILDIFDFQFLYGNQDMALSDINSIVITDELAYKIFGKQLPIGEIIQLGDDKTIDYKVTGVVKKCPSNSILKFDAFVSFENVRGNLFWQHWNYETFILLPKDYPPYELELKLAKVIEKYRKVSNIENTDLILQPLTQIHASLNPINHLPTQRKTVHIYIFISLGLFVLVLACLNFINLSTVYLTIRRDEVFMRKVVGASINQLMKQFLGESILISFIALNFALILANSTLPLFNYLSGKYLSFNIFDLRLMFVFLFLTLLLGIVVGFYPAYLISKPRGVYNLVEKGKFNNFKNKLGFRRILILIQFIISITIFVCNIVMHKQLNYILNKNLGYDVDNMLVIKIWNKRTKSNRELFKSNILQNHGVVSCSAVSYLPGENGFFQNAKWEGLHEGRDEYMNWIPVDYDFIKTFGLKLVNGRNFSREYPTDIKSAYILNESAVKYIGWNNPIGKNINIVDEGKVVGVIKDFHYKSLIETIQPMALYIYPELFENIIVRINTDDKNGTLNYIKSEWQKMFPLDDFEYSYYKDEFSRLYNTEFRLGKIFDSISILTMVITCLGLFGLSSFSAERRSKEISIRKIHGAETAQIIYMLSEDFSKWVLLAFIIACPIGYYGMDKWLQNFAYKTTINWWVFLIAGVLTFAIALLTVSWQSWSVASRNPVESLRDE